MSNQEHTGTGQILLEQFVKVDVPELKKIHKSVSEGQKLSAGQLEVMKRYLEESHALSKFVHEFPEYEDIVMGSIEVYHEITEMALKNEGG